MSTEQGERVLIALNRAGVWLEAFMFAHVLAWLAFLAVFTAGWSDVAYLVAIVQAGTASLGTTIALRHRSLRREAGHEVAP